MPLVRHRLPGQVLAGNPLGDPAERDLFVDAPPDHDPDAARRCPGYEDGAGGAA